MMTAPPNGLVPTAVHAPSAGHETLFHALDDAGVSSSAHVEPSLVAMAVPVSLVNQQIGVAPELHAWVFDSPTAVQAVGETQETPERVETLVGTVSLVQVAPPSFVATMSAPPRNSPPTAVHAVVDGQETEDSGVAEPGGVSLVHVAPPSVVATMSVPPGTLPEPTAVHVVVDGQEMEARGNAPLGAFWPVHVAPPSLVAMMAASPDWVSPTAKQVDVDGHES
jgi:hypothetical protein